jgi:uncharacterized protein (TIGR02284 family)
MATTVGTESEVIHLLKNLIRLDYDAIDAYQAAVDRLDDSMNREQFSTFMADHKRHTENVGMLLKDLGEVPPEKGDLKSYLTQGKVIIGGLMGDNAIIKAMKTNEEDTNKAYSMALERTDLSPEMRSTLEQNLADERAHKAWIETHMK